MKDTPNNKDTGVIVLIVPSVSIRRNLLAPVFFVIFFCAAGRRAGGGNRLLPISNEGRIQFNPKLTHLAGNIPHHDQIYSVYKHPLIL